MLIRRIPEQLPPAPLPSNIVIDFDSLWTIPPYDSLTVNGLTGVSSFSAPAVTALVMTDCFGMSAVNLNNCADTTAFSFSSCNDLNTITVADAMNGTQFVVSTTPLDEASVDAILIAFAAGTGVDGIMNLTSACAPPSGAASSAIADLADRGWTVTTN
jgi:hypothetical protein